MLAMDQCPACGQTYSQFRTGLTFAQVRQSLYSATEDTEQWRQKRRRSVLGHWRELKQRMFEDYHHGCDDG